FNIAYRFGAIFLAEPYPGGPGRPDLAIELLQKGLRERPGKWEYMEDIAFVHYWYNHDYIAASDWFRKASELPEAPWWLRSMAAYACRNPPRCFHSWWSRRRSPSPGSDTNADDARRVAIVTALSAAGRAGQTRGQTPV